MNWLPSLKNRIKLNEPLSLHTTFKIGGPSLFWFEPKNLKELIEVYKFIRKENIPLLVLGGGSNILVKDKGWPGITIRLSQPSFKRIDFDGYLVKAGAGQSLSRLVNFSLENSLGGCEFLSGIPGTVGGAIMINAGTRDIENNKKFLAISNIIREISVLDKNGRVRVLKRKDIDFDYRHSNLGGNIILEAKLKLIKSSRKKVSDLIKKFWAHKKNTQDFSQPGAGCIFKNPPNTLKSSGQLIDQAGFKGKRIGEAQVSKKHANFIVNTGEARAKDVLTLMENIQKQVEKDCSIWLEPEIQIVG